MLKPIATSLKSDNYNYYFNDSRNQQFDGLLRTHLSRLCIQLAIGNMPNVDADEYICIIISPSLSAFK